MSDALIEMLNKGGPALWAIAALSVCTLALILWKIWQLMRLGAWGGRRANCAAQMWLTGDRSAALALARNGKSLRLRVVAAAFAALGKMERDQAKEETARVARAVMRDARQGLRPLELVMTIAPLIGLLGTVLGMIDAFQALQDSGNRADPAALAGGIWEALLTTAAGMAVAIPAGMALTWFEALAESVAHDLEDLATRIFNAE
ncbi:MotA/TolQ/ExbB proton channel family protein [Pseudoprimorskyibacter insulae]|uniref:Biopolymer transport protein ExbB n=1 Tax=Pseudoprimorskyibacter insulae TaxID=1695997 RepID=A0A2R8AQX1_9RHOB|nr:MotA/TolQ/ExbB proton channel family protein [Pseudoprimorskyibacter insulae]SPF78370.1 Biopolymer transport protein ExbB [Pseudoprimorskyibacter insulae]